MSEQETRSDVTLYRTEIIPVKCTDTTEQGDSQGVFFFLSFFRLIFSAIRLGPRLG